MPTTIRVAIVAAASMGLLGTVAALSGTVESILLLGMAFWIVRGALRRERSMQDLAFGFALIGSFTTGAPALLLLVRGVLERRTDVWTSIPMLFVQLAPFVALAICLSRPSAERWFSGTAAAPGGRKGAPVSAAQR